MTILKNDEYVLTNTDIIVTKTDLQGFITFVNDDLIRITGFTRQELLGRNHNIFRHSDMPSEVFFDLWCTILSGCTWTGVIKNKTKDGGFYWVKADVTPIYDGNVLIGYMSVRRKPSADKLSEAKKAYAQMKEGKFTGELRYGQLVKKSFFLTTHYKLSNISIVTKLGGLVGLASFVVVLLAVIDHINLSRLNDNNQQLFMQVQSYSNQLNRAYTEQIKSLEHENALLKDKVALYEPSSELSAVKVFKKPKEETKLTDYFYQVKTSSNQSLLNIQNINIFLVFVALIVMNFLCEFISRSIINPLKEATRVLTEISSGNYRVPIEYRSKSEIGLMIEALRSTSVRLGFDTANEKKINIQMTKALETNQVLNHQVNQMQKIESISRLTSGIAHDFNNILAAIIGYNQLNTFVAEDCQDAQFKEEILFNTDQVNIASLRAVGLIKKMMAYSRQNPTNKEIEIRPTCEVINEVLDMMRPALTSLFQLHADVDSNLIIQIDSTELHQILTNLIVNARDAMQHGGNVSISLKQGTKHDLICNACIETLEGDFIELSISDTGTGIGQKVIDHIFDPFFTTKPVGEGTGLGLSTVSGMVHEAHGHITIESKTTAPNTGTTFRLLFPQG